MALPRPCKGKPYAVADWDPFGGTGIGIYGGTTILYDYKFFADYLSLKSSIIVYWYNSKNNMIVNVHNMN